MYFRPTLGEFTKQLQDKKTQIETQKRISESNHKSALEALHNAYLAFASCMFQYFEETRKAVNQNELFFTVEENDWCYMVTYYSPRRLEVILSNQNQYYITLDYYQALPDQEGSVEVTEKLTTEDADINRAARNFQDPVFMGNITKKLLECVQ